MLSCVVISASALGVTLNRAPPFWIVNRSKPVQFAAMRAGLMGGKKIHGRKRFLLTDTLGLLIAVKVLTAHLDEREGGKVLLLSLDGELPRLELIWVESGYAGRPFEQWVKEHLGVRVEVVNHPWTGIRGVWVKEGEEVDWNAIIPPGFHLLPHRWVVERTNAWVTRNRRLSRDYEGTHSSREAFIYLAMSRLMLARLARAAPSAMLFCTLS